MLDDTHGLTLVGVVPVEASPAIAERLLDNVHELGLEVAVSSVSGAEHEVLVVLRIEVECAELFVEPLAEAWQDAIELAGAFATVAPRPLADRGLIAHHGA